MLNRVIKYFLDNPLIVYLGIVLLMGWGIAVSPFDWQTNILPNDPVPVDAIPDIGENQQIVFTRWPGRSPQDMEDQVTYPLSTALLGIPGVKTIRSSSMFGISSIYIIFNEDTEYYWSRGRILEKLNSLPMGTLPENVSPALGPDATALGQIYWYTLEGRDEAGNPTGGWDLHELRSIQDFQVKYALTSAEGVSEVASVGGHVKEYQVDVDPGKLQVYGIGLKEVVEAIKNSNRDAGAQTIEINKVEYFVRGIGYLKTLGDLEQAVIRIEGDVPLRIKDVARVNFGPATRRGILDKSGTEAVGGVVVARYGSNPLRVINNVKEKIAEISKGLPVKTLDDGTISKVTIIPFYDRTNLIHETLGTLEEALSLEILITIMVVIVMVVNLRASILISGLLPIAVLLCFIAMKYFHVDANIVALSGIAIAIGTMVDMGIVLSENILRHMKISKAPLGETIYNATKEVSGALITAVTTTVISFLPVFAMEAAEGKLFKPLAFTKTFAIVASVLVALFIIPTIARLVFGWRIKGTLTKALANGLLTLTGIFLMIFQGVTMGILVTLGGLVNLTGLIHFPLISKILDEKRIQVINIGLVLIAVNYILTGEWMPLGPAHSFMANFLFISLFIGLLLLLFYAVIKWYEELLGWCLRHKILFLSLPVMITTFGIVIWFGFSTTFRFIEKGANGIGFNLQATSLWSEMTHTFPGLGKEFMPSLDEGSFLLMPSSMPHAGIEENKRVLQQLDMAVTSIPEIELVVGKLGRTESALDPAPISMYENIITYKPEYALDEKGNRRRFKTDDQGRFLLPLPGGGEIPVTPGEEAWVDSKHLLQDPDGKFFRQWRKHIKSTDDLWEEIVKVTTLPGITSAPKLQPIETRLIMLQTGMRAPMGIKIKGSDLGSIEAFGKELELALKEVPAIRSETVFADRVIGKPYIHINIDREKIARYGLSIEHIQRYIETAIGGMTLTVTVEGRERFPVRARYPRELRDSPEALKNILIPTPSGTQIPLGDLSELEYVKGPQVIKSEDTFLVGYVLFDRVSDFSENEVVDKAREHLENKIASGSITVPAGISYRFAGNYENQTRAEKKLQVIIPVALIIIFLVLYMQFRSVPVTFMVFGGIALAFSGGFIMIWLYGTDWFMDFSLFGENMRDLFHLDKINLSVAVWVGFLALFGIATDDGVIMATYQNQQFARMKNKPVTMSEMNAVIIEAGSRRIRPCLMTAATTILALLPVLSSTGKGSDIMVPMAIPVFGGMVFQLITLFIVPVLYSVYKANELNIKALDPHENK